MSVTSELLLGAFNRVCHSPWVNTKDFVSYRYEGKKLILQPSKQIRDWIRNFIQIPWPVKIGGIWVFIPLGFAFAWWSLKKVIKANPPDEVEAFSHGAPLGAYVSAELGIPALVFGCPGYVLPGKGAKILFRRVTHVRGERDVVARVMWPFTKGYHRMTMCGTFSRPKGLGWFAFITGHATAEYRYLIEHGTYEYGR